MIYGISINSRHAKVSEKVWDDSKNAGACGLARAAFNALRGKLPPEHCAAFFCHNEETGRGATLERFAA